MTEKKVHVRFSPSPTGFLHIGGARTALYNWLFARHEGGTFSLRIEDTDQARSEPRFVEDIKEGLKWLGIDWDSGPLFQSSRLEIYKKYAERLVREGKAYWSEEEKGRAIRFRMPDEEIKFDDVIRGLIRFDASLIEDFVILKADGFPTYNFACTIDDIEMGITHVIRGDDHIANTPKQLAIYNALGVEPPRFAHLPMILGEDGARLSKRHGATSVREYKELGYLPEALANFIALLGWAPGDDREIVSVDEMIKSFTLERVGKTSARFNNTKLDWMNSQYIRQLPIDDLLQRITPFLQRVGVEPEKLPGGWLSRVVELHIERFKTLADFYAQTSFLFTEEIDYDPAAVDKLLKKGTIPELLQEAHSELSRVKDFDKDSLERCLRGLVKRRGIGFGKLAQPLRVAVTGKTVSAGLFETMELLGRQKTLQRISHCLSTFCKTSSV
ncbi:MAG: glutamate--tRNA ligase [Candidatus Brocadiales bacterium]